MEIIHISAELAPIAKVGGLADVLHGLSRAVIQKGHSVKIVLPKYDTLDLSQAQNLEIIDHYTVSFDGRVCKNTLWQACVDGIPVILIESHEPEKFFEREQVYGCHDDISRFLYFCVSALEYLYKQSCDAIHLHDWHTAALAGLVKKDKKMRAKTVLTIHNLAYQGLCSRQDLAKIEWIDDALVEGECYNLLKGGIIYADHVTTVSTSYAQEVLTTQIGGVLQSTLKKYAFKFTGVLNGIDYSYWNPETDPHLPIHYSLNSLAQKQEAKRALKIQLGLADVKAPLVCAITRLVYQKGPELIKAAILRTLEWGGQFVLIGSALDPKTASHFNNLKQAFAGSCYVHFELDYNEQLSHVVFAGSDLLVIPSLFEPCGLTQLIAMRYGTVPIARQTGGLIDTVFDGKNGFTFGPATVDGLNVAIDRALETWYSHPERWQKIQKSGMESDFSWNNPAEEYLRIYSLPPLSVNNLRT